MKRVVKSFAGLLEVLGNTTGVTAQVKWRYKGLFDTLAPPGGKYKAFAQGIAAE